MKKGLLGGLIACLFLNPLCFAQAIYLKNGKKVEGKIILRTDREIKINVQGVTLTYYSDEIERIETSETPSAPPSKTITIQRPGLLQPEISIVPSPSLSSPLSSGRTKQGLVLELIEASGAKDSMNQIFHQLLTQSSPEDAQKLRQIFDTNEIILEMIPVYEKYFTEEELKELINFYKSPAGQKLLKATPLIMQDSVQVSLQYFQKKIQESGLGASLQQPPQELPSETSAP